jgi:hypothetical protein
MNEPARAGSITLDRVEVFDAVVVVRWHSRDLVTPWPPMEPPYAAPNEPRHEPITLTDHLNTSYECSGGDASFTNGSRGTCRFTPGPPPEAQSLHVMTPARIYDIKL